MTINCKEGTMRTCVSISVLIFVVCFCRLSAQPSIESEPIIYPKAQYAPVIDGAMDSLWYNVPRYPMFAEEVNYAAPDDFYDTSGEWRAMWDADYLYFLVEIRDDVPLTGMDWNYDSIELYSDADYSHGPLYDGMDDVQLRFHLDDESRSITVYTSDQGPEFDVSEFVWEQEYTDLGWRLEVAMPVVDLFMDTGTGIIIGTECQYNDNDDGTECQHKLISFGDVEEHWQRPELFGSAIMSGWVASDTLMVMRTRTQPEIDGVEDDVWQEVPPISATGYISFDNIVDLWDLSMTFRSMWDANYLYYLVTVWDDKLVRDGSGDHNDDGIEIYSDGDYSHGAGYDGVNDYQFAFRYEETADLIQAVHLTGSSAGTPADLSGVLQAAKETDEGGISLEVALPMSLLQITPQPGIVYGMEVDYNDDDDGGDRDTKLKTYSKSDDTWQYPNMMVPAKLVDEPSVLVEKDVKESILTDYALLQNYPNPFNPSTTIAYVLAAPAHVEVTVYDLQGKKVAFLVDEEQSAGYYRVEFDGTSLPSGVYFAAFTAGSRRQVNKMMLLK